MSLRTVFYKAGNGSSSSRVGPAQILAVSAGGAGHGTEGIAALMPATVPTTVPAPSPAGASFLPAAAPGTPRASLPSSYFIVNATAPAAGNSHGLGTPGAGAAGEGAAGEGAAGAGAAGAGGVCSSTAAGAAPLFSAPAPAASSVPAGNGAGTTSAVQLTYIPSTSMGMTQHSTAVIATVLAPMHAQGTNLQVAVPWPGGGGGGICGTVTQPQIGLGQMVHGVGMPSVPASASNVGSAGATFMGAFLPPGYASTSSPSVLQQQQPKQQQQQQQQQQEKEEEEEEQQQQEQEEQRRKAGAVQVSSNGLTCENRGGRREVWQDVTWHLGLGGSKNESQAVVTDVGLSVGVKGQGGGRLSVYDGSGSDGGGSGRGNGGGGGKGNSCGSIAIAPLPPSIARAGAGGAGGGEVVRRGGKGGGGHGGGGGGGGGVEVETDVARAGAGPLAVVGTKRKESAQSNGSEVGHEHLPVKKSTSQLMSAWLKDEPVLTLAAGSSSHQGTQSLSPQAAAAGIPQRREGSKGKLRTPAKSSSSATGVKGKVVGMSFVDPEDGVLCKIRAKRGFATHPRSIAERVRRSRISDNMKKLAELVPHIDKQANTADMLDEAIEYLKHLQHQLRTVEVNHPHIQLERYVSRHERYQGSESGGEDDGSGGDFRESMDGDEDDSHQLGTSAASDVSAREGPQQGRRDEVVLGRVTSLPSNEDSRPFLTLCTVPPSSSSPQTESGNGTACHRTSSY